MEFVIMILTTTLGRLIET